MRELSVAIFEMLKTLDDFGAEAARVYRDFVPERDSAGNEIEYPNMAFRKQPLQSKDRGTAITQTRWAYEFHIHDTDGDNCETLADNLEAFWEDNQNIPLPAKGSVSGVFVETVSVEEEPEKTSSGMTVWHAVLVVEFWHVNLNP